MLSYRFYIRNNQDTTPLYVEIEEPIGWDGCTFTLQRSAQFDGLDNVYSDDLTFYGLAGDILFYAFNNYGFDAVLDFKIEFYCDGVLNTTIENIINMLTYKRVGNETTVQMEESSVARKFLSRYQTEINFGDSLSIGGEPLTPINPLDLPLHSKEIVLKDTRELDDRFDRTTNVFKYSVSGVQGDYNAPPYNIIIASASNIENGSGFLFSEKTFYFQYDFINQITTDANIGTFYDIPYGGGEDANPFLKVQYGGKININLNFNIACLVRVDDNSSGLAGTAKINGCDSYDDGLHLNGTFFYDLYIKIGNIEYTFPISSGARNNCDEKYYSDLYGKVDWVGAGSSLDPADGDTISLKPNKYRFKEISLNQNFDCEAGDDIYVLVRLKESAEYEKKLLDTRIIVVAAGWIDKKDSFLNITSVGEANPSTTNAFMVYEAFNRVCESMTDQLNSFRSNFFGRTNSLPQTYSVNGCGALIALTNGLNIRKMLDANGNLYPLTMSFFDLYTSFNAIFNLGARVESDGNGGYYIRVEPKEYFYDNSEEVFTATSPSEITTVVAIDKLYNDIEIGYQTWEIDNLNGIDEFNASHTYSLPLVNVQQRVELGQGTGVTSPFVGGGYAIEMTRRLQYSENPTTDWQYDNNNFIICLNQIPVTSDKYSNPPTLQSYDIGKVSERNESYISVTNLISPETAYNLRISPGNMILNWFKCLAPSLLLKPIKAVQFQSGEGNYQMVTQRVDYCSISNGIIVENQDVTIDVTNLSDIQEASLYTPVYISFDYPLDFGSFIAIKEKSNKLIRVECDELTYFGFISELIFTPNDGSANFKILLTGCFKGGFVRTGFTNGFEIGTC